MFFVPKIGKNIVSGVCLNCEGFKQVHESDRYILSRLGIFVGFGYLYNKIFRLNIINKISCDKSVFVLSSFNSSSKINDSMLWHARLGHINFRRMHQMSKDNLIHAINVNTEKCKMCVLTKITKQSFQMLNEILLYWI